jgi:hypothetical protein
MQEHPRTEAINMWNKIPLANIRDYPIRLGHLK